MSRPSQIRSAALLAPLAVLWTLACGGDLVEPTPSPSFAVTPEASALQVALGSTDLSVGENRLTFGLIDRDTGPVRDVPVVVSTFRLKPRGPEGPVQTVDGVFRKWPVAPSGVYTAHVSFDDASAWGIGVSAALGDGAVRSGSVRVEVRETSVTPPVGSPAPASRSKTLSDVDGLEELTTDRRPDPSLYELSIAEAIRTGSLAMVLFATPAYCSTSTCGPQIEVVKQLKARFGNRMSFIHVEVYDNPSEIEGDLSRGVISPTVKEWGLPSEPWTFLIDGDGLVDSKFEAFTTLEELEEAVSGLLER